MHTSHSLKVEGKLVTGRMQPLKRAFNAECVMVAVKNGGADGYDAGRYSVGMHEGVWKRVDRPGEPANREHMLMALAGLEYIIVKVGIWKYKFRNGRMK